MSLEQLDLADHVAIEVKPSSPIHVDTLPHTIHTRKTDKYPVQFNFGKPQGFTLCTQRENCSGAFGDVEKQQKMDQSRAAHETSKPDESLPIALPMLQSMVDRVTITKSGACYHGLGKN